MLIDCKKIAEILSLSGRYAQRLCSNGTFETAKRMGNAWCAEDSEVIEYLRTARNMSKGPQPGRARNSISDEVRNKVIAVAGKKPDLQIAKEIGMSHVTVAKIRESAGISKPSHDNYCWDVYDALLGKKPDKEIASEIGCTQATVCKRRMKMKIPAYNPGRED